MSFPTKSSTKNHSQMEMDIEATLLPSLGDVDFPFQGKIHAPRTEEYSQSIEKNYAYNTKCQDEMYPALFAYPDNGELKSIESAIAFGRQAGLHVIGPL